MKRFKVLLCVLAVSIIISVAIAGVVGVKKDNGMRLIVPK